LDNFKKKILAICSLNACFHSDPYIFSGPKNRSIWTDTIITFFLELLYIDGFSLIPKVDVVFFIMRVYNYSPYILWSSRRIWTTEMTSIFRSEKSMSSPWASSPTWFGSRLLLWSQELWDPKGIRGLIIRTQTIPISMIDELFFIQSKVTCVTSSWKIFSSTIEAGTHLTNILYSIIINRGGLQN